MPRDGGMTIASINSVINNYIYSESPRRRFVGVGSRLGYRDEAREVNLVCDSTWNKMAHGATWEEVSTLWKLLTLI